jgi:hypothetical protein
MRHNHSVYAIAIAITRARARPRTGLLTSSSTAPLPRQPPAQWYASMSSPDMAFALPPPLHWQPSRTTGHAGAACPGIVDVDMAGLTSRNPFTTHLCTSAPRFCLTLTRRAQPCIRLHPIPLALVHHFGAGARARWPALAHLFGIR